MQTRLYKILFSLWLITALSCSTNEIEPDVPEIQIIQTENQAKIVGVTCTGPPNGYTFSVTIKSPDTGCEQYADWWEVFSPDSTLIYRRVLGHSHVDEQPFTRSGGTVDVDPDAFIYVRAHMNNTGYGSQVYSGTVREGLKEDSLSVNYAASLSTQPPLPTDCAF